MYSLQVAAENKYSKKDIRSHIITDLENGAQIIGYLTDYINIYRKQSYYASKNARINKLTVTDEELALEILIAVLPVKEIMPFQAVATQIAQNLGYDLLLDGIKTAAELLAVCTISNVFDIYHSSNSVNETGTLGIRSNYALEAHTEALIKQTKYLPPMICKPLPWTKNSNGGHIQGSGSVILGFINHHDDQQALDVLNILQGIAWSINDMVVYEEKSKKDLDTQDKVVQFEAMCQESLIVYDELRSHGNKFYFVWKYDKRGRMYSQGYHCNLQGTEYKKAILNFAKKELIQ